jgi:hypothetical protein
MCVCVCVCNTYTFLLQIAQEIQTTQARNEIHKVNGLEQSVTRRGIPPVRGTYLKYNRMCPFAAA